MAGARLHFLHGPGGAPWIGGGFEDTINGFLTYREALMMRLRLTLLAGRPDLPVHLEQRHSAQEGLLEVQDGHLTKPATSLQIPLLMSDIVYESVPTDLRHLGDYIIAIAPRGPTLRLGEGVESDLKQVWFLCFRGAQKKFEEFMSQLSHAGALRWDAMDVLSQTWRLLHVGRCKVASCWPRMAIGTTKHGGKVALPACVAVKTMDFSAAEMEKELKILRRCHHHPSISSFMGVFCLEDPSKIPASATQGRCWAMVTALESGNDLQRRVEARKFLEEATVVKAMLGVSGAVAFLHKLKIIHRRVEPSHILLNYEGTGILTDFSSAVDLSEAPSQWAPIPSTPNTAPEILTGKYDGMVDVFGMGVVLYFALCGSLPFTVGTQKTSKQSKVNYTIAALDRASNGVRLLLRAALARDAHNRPTAKAAFVALWHLASDEQRSFATRSALMLKDD